jgi:hypothetical protein
LQKNVLLQGFLVMPLFGRDKYFFHAKTPPQIMFRLQALPTKNITSSIRIFFLVFRIM